MDEEPGSGTFPFLLIDSRIDGNSVWDGDRNNLEPRSDDRPFPSFDRLAACRSERLLWIRFIDTPPSSAAKSNPLWMDWIPVAMSVRLPNDLREYIEGREGYGKAPVGLSSSGLASSSNLPPSRGWCQMSKEGLSFRADRSMSTSFGKYKTFTALKIYLGRRQRTSKITLLNQKKTDRKRKWLFPLENCQHGILYRDCYGLLQSRYIKPARGDIGIYNLRQLREVSTPEQRTIP